MATMLPVAAEASNGATMLDSHTLIDGHWQLDGSGISFGAMLTVAAATASMATPSQSVAGMLTGAQSGSQIGSSVAAAASMTGASS
jgi:hypothetical protein